MAVKSFIAFGPIVFMLPRLSLASSLNASVSKQGGNPESGAPLGYTLGQDRPLTSNIR
jgi:hypothetical protein